MDAFQFAASLEWPVVTLVVFLTLRKPIRRTLDGIDLSEIQIGTFRARFDQRLAEVERLVPPVAHAATARTARSTPDPSPRDAILGAMQQLYLRLPAGRDGEGLGRGSEAALGAAGLDANEIAALQGLFELGRLVAQARGASVTREDADRYQAVAEALLARLRPP